MLPRLISMTGSSAVAATSLSACPPHTFLVNKVFCFPSLYRIIAALTAILTVFVPLVNIKECL